MKSAGYDSGWPVYEGFDLQPQYSPIRVPNPDAPNPLFNGTSCTLQFFTFNDLIVQDTLDPPSWPNPCNPAVQIPASIPRFVNRRAGLIYGRDLTLGPLLTPTFTNGMPTSIPVGAPGSPVSGTQFGGFVASAVAWYQGTDFPAAYQNSYFVADFDGGKLVNIHYDANDQPVSVAIFDDATPNGIVSLATSPTTGGLYAVEVYSDQVYRIAYQSSANQPPVAQGGGNARLRRDTARRAARRAAGRPIPRARRSSYFWSLRRRRRSSALADPIHFYFGPVGVPTTYTATLTVRDPQNQTSTAQVRVYVNNTPPQVTITSPANQGMYAMTGSAQYPLTALISDAESGCGPARVRLADHAPPQRRTSTPGRSTRAAARARSSTPSAATETTTGTRSRSRSPTRRASPPRARSRCIRTARASCPPICGNLDASVFRNASDLSRLRSAFANPITNGLSPGELSRCSMIGGTECDVADLTVLRRYLAGRAPGPAPVCPAAQP